MSFTIRLKPEDIRRIDQSDMGGHIANMGSHIREGVKLGAEVGVPISAEKCKSILVLGMGGSAIGGDLVKAYLSKLRIPFFVHRGYELPEWVNEETLVIASSYSGNTEETLSTFEEAAKKKLPILCITTGGMLAERAKALALPMVTIPGGMQPRAAIAYSFACILLAVEKMSGGHSESANLERAAAMLDSLAARYGVEQLDEKNLAFKLAGNLVHRIPVIYSSVNEEPIALRWRGQIQENGKHIAFANILPEMNHNEIEGWAHPIDLVQHFA
ncbi:MAG TPA: bifunctional phosphoglucose/phosphomannose isomerase, partial [Candidatus Kapabacteria bacterium]